MFLKGGWFIIAGVLLLGHTSVLAEPYLRVRKNGVIYYYYSSRESPPPRQGGMNSRAWRGVPPEPLTRPTPGEKEALIQEPSTRHHLPVTAHDWQVVNPSDTKEYIWAGARYLLSLLTKLGYHYSLALPVSEAGCRWLERHQNGTSIQEPAVIAAAGCDDFLKYNREPQAALGQVKQGLDEWQQPYYCFPVSGPFSFRNSWGDYRSGGRHHRAVDIFAREGAAVYAVTAGVINTLATWNGAGITLLMRGQDGRGYGYMHLQGYAEGMVVGKAVRTGELLGYVGRTGLRQSAAHLHFEVYADHRLDKNDLLNPYYFLVQLCHGVGVTDLYDHQIAYRQEPQIKVNKIQVYRRPGSTTLTDRGSQPGAKDSSILVIRNF